MNEQMPLVKLTDAERLDLGRRAAKLGGRLEELKLEYGEVKKDFNERIEETQTELLQNLRALNE